ISFERPARTQISLSKHDQPWQESDQPMEVEGKYHSCIGKEKSRKKGIRHAERTRHSSEERNARERKRVKMVNAGFDLLHKKIPLLSPIRKVSKLQILRGAKSYIMQLQELLLEHNFSASPASAEVTEVPVSLAESMDAFLNNYLGKQVYLEKTPDLNNWEIKSMDGAGRKM
uniref:BHLH domain-containing protein n=1 Tax=Erpetoichthys calabaricus TaxID=27687 RepID=A0A8C4X9Y4_ERPCA